MVTFILGGARSGKSSYALELAKEGQEKVAFIATCVNQDKEMKEKIKKHKLSRPQNWKLVEEGRNIASVLPQIVNKYRVILIDCLGLWVSNLLLDELKDNEIEKKFHDLLDAILGIKTRIILISNEVGSGIVPDNLLARRFRDLLGSLNQMIAKKADEVIFMQCGIPIKIKEA